MGDMNHEMNDTKNRADARIAEWDRLLAQAGRAEDLSLPPTVVATPSALHALAKEEIRWWRPGFADSWRYVGWRWVLLLPSLLVVAFFIWPTWIMAPFFTVYIYVFVFMVAIAVTLAGYVFRKAARARKEPFCIFCGYNLTGLPDNYRCPECGKPYTWRLIAEYRRDPQWFIERYRALRRLPPPAQPFDAGKVPSRKSRDGT